MRSEEIEMKKREELEDKVKKNLKKYKELSERMLIEEDKNKVLEIKLKEEKIENQSKIAKLYFKENLSFI